MVFGYIAKRIKYVQLKAENDKCQNELKGNMPCKSEGETILSNLDKNLEEVKNITNNSGDIIIHEFNFGYEKQVRGALVYVDGMVDRDVIQRNILYPLIYDIQKVNQNKSVDIADMDTIRNRLLSVSDVKKIILISDLIDKLLDGNTILMFDGLEGALGIHAIKFESRAVSEPETESVVRGPREGFVESIKVNKVMIRRKIKDPDLCFESMKIGDKSRTEVCIVYLKSVAGSKLIEEVRVRLKRIKIDAILESGYIEEFIEDAPYSVFSTVGNSEKPDRVAAGILEGRAAILVDGTPFALIVPLLFVGNFQSAEDYYSRPFFSSFLRILRYTSYLASVLAPAVYVALTVYHQELIPTQLLISFAAGRQQVPFPAVMEAFMMMFTFDILREAGVRLPKPVGSAVSIVGALVLGQSAVSAGLVSPIMVIVVASTAIASFVVPPQTDSSSLLRYMFLILAGLAGGFGIIMGGLVTLIHLASLRSFGVPYLSPVVPLIPSDLKDTFIRTYLWDMVKRPRLIGRHNSTREKSGLAPSAKKKSSENLHKEK